MKLSCIIAFCKRKPTFGRNCLAKGSCLIFYCESLKFLSNMAMQIKLNVKTPTPDTHVFKLESKHCKGAGGRCLIGFTYCCVTSTPYGADIQQLFVNRMDQTVAHSCIE